MIGKLTAMKKAVRKMVPFFLLLLAPALFAQETRALPGNRGFATVKQILDRSCAACHDWTATHERIIKEGGVVPGKPDQSKLYTQIASDAMPLSGPKLSADEKAFIRGWIQAGASASDLPLSVERGSKAEAPKPAISLAQLKLPFHEIGGFTSVGLFGAAGVLGVIHYIDMKDMIHSGGFFAGGEGSGGDIGGEGSEFGAMTQIWNNQQSLRWWHAGLVIGGETLYVGNLISGLTMLTPHIPGKVTKADIHRWAFFIHLTLMTAQIALGLLETDALSHGYHDAAIAYTGAHALIGVAIPVIMLYAGVENVLPEPAPRPAARPAAKPRR